MVRSRRVFPAPSPLRFCWWTELLCDSPGYPEKCFLLDVTTGLGLPDPHSWAQEDLGGQRSRAVVWELGLQIYRDTSASMAAQRKGRPRLDGAASCSSVTWREGGSDTALQLWLHPEETLRQAVTVPVHHESSHS